MREEILELSVPLFANAGYDGVSMRDVAMAVGVTPAALYHHFSDKGRLYLDAVGHAFRDKAVVLNAILNGSEDPWLRLESFIVAFAKMLDKEKDFRRLMQWVQMDSDEQRLRKLGDSVFHEVFAAVHRLAGELGRGHDLHLLSFSILGMILFPFEAGNARRFLPGYRARLATPRALARHVVSLLRHGLSGADIDKMPSGKRRK